MKIKRKYEEKTLLISLSNKEIEEVFEKAEFEHLLKEAHMQVALYKDETKHANKRNTLLNLADLTENDYPKMVNLFKAARSSAVPDDITWKNVIKDFI